MKITLFSVDEANRAVQEIGPELEALVRVKRELDRVQSRMHVLEVAVAGASADNPDARELSQHAEHTARLADRVRTSVSSIHRRGCVIKDLDMGLLDFYSLETG